MSRRKAMPLDRPMMPPATTPEEREKQVISLAYEVAERQMLSGTASSQVITHFLKRSTGKEQLEEEILRLKQELLKAQTEAMQSQQRSEELYAKALKAMQTYSGSDDEDEYYD